VRSSCIRDYTVIRLFHIPVHLKVGPIEFIVPKPYSLQADTGAHVGSY
jgi:hypothetical protein